MNRMTREECLEVINNSRYKDVVSIMVKDGDEEKYYSGEAGSINRYDNVFLLWIPRGAGGHYLDDRRFIFDDILAIHNYVLDGIDPDKRRYVKTPDGGLFINYSESNCVLYEDTKDIELETEFGTIIGEFCLHLSNEEKISIMNNDTHSILEVPISAIKFITILD